MTATRNVNRPLTTVGDRLDAMIHAITALEGQLALLEQSAPMNDGPGLATQTQIVACAKEFLDDIWNEWFWLDENRDSFDALAAPTEDERAAVSRITAGGAR